MRCFLAVEIPGEIRSALGELRDAFRECVRGASWVRNDNMHLTLRFLGKLEENQYKRYMDALGNAVSAFGAVALSAEGAGVFPNIRRPSVLWAGLRVVSGDLTGIQACAEHAARAIGLDAEPKPFHPHVTLARLRDARASEGLAAMLASRSAWRGGEFEAASVTLFSSELRPGGAVYRPLQEFLLHG